VGARRTIEHRGATFTEMDVEAILRRRPQQVLVDEFAHTNVPGSRHEKRWEDVEELLAAGIDVVSTVNIQHLESLNDVVERITGITQRETVPDSVVRAADQIELVDMDPDALRRRMAHGNIYAADKIDAALGNYFREGNLSALRELALLWVADRVDDALAEYRERHRITRPWETRERVVVAVSGAPAGAHLVRRAARIAQRGKGDLIGVHVVDGSGLVDRPLGEVDTVAQARRLLEELGGEYRRVAGNDIASALVDVARSENATQIVLGASKRSRWQLLVHGSVINRVVRMSGHIDVHVISERPDGAGTELEGDRRLPAVKPVLSPLPRRRQLWGLVIAAVGLPVLTLLFANARDTFSLTTVLLVYLVLAMLVAVVGGLLPALAAGLAAFLLANWFFTPPYYEFTIHEGENLIALVVFLMATGLVAVLVDRVGRMRLRAGRARAEAEALAAVAGSGAQPDSLAAVLDQVRAPFGFRSAALLQRDGDGWIPLAVSGTQPPVDGSTADVVRQLGDGVSLALAGGQLAAEDERVLDAFATQVAAVAEANRLHAEAAKAGELAAVNDLRAALLQAVSHDLRTPLAAIKASISSLRQDDIDWPPETEAEFEETIEVETDRLTALVGNLLDMSRLQADAVVVELRDTGVDEVVLAAIAGLGAGGSAVVVDITETLPLVRADPALLERVVANLLANAIRAAPDEEPPRVTAGVVGGEHDLHVDIRVIDRGPGIERADRELVFQPFQRLGDRRGSGVGLGLAIARGFVEAMAGELVIEDTPGGGTTMVVSLPLADVEAS
jgi:two-component system sensor histidine kinase KdpD